MRHMNLSGPRGRVEPLEQQETTDKLGFFTSLVHPDYRRLWVATGCAQSASWALIILRGALLLLPVIHFIGHETAFFVSTGLYAIGWTQVVRIRTVSRGTVEVARGIFFNLAAGIGYIYTHPMIFAIMILTVLHCALTMAFESVLPYFSRNILGMTTGGDLFKGPTYLMIGIGAGGIVGNLVLARVQSGKIRGQLFLWVGLASGLAPMVFGLTTTVSQAMLAATRSEERRV